MACKHEFIGNAEGVKCSLCGAELTVEEYREYLKAPKEVETPKEVVAEKVEQPKATRKSTKKK